MALLLPPLRRRERRHAALDLARQRERRASHLREAPARLDPHVDVHAARAAGLGPAPEPELLEQRLHLERDAAHVVPHDARRRVEVDAQLVRMVEVAAENRMRVQLDAAEVHDPREPGRVVDDDLLRGASRRKRERHGADPLRTALRCALLVEGVGVRAVDEALQHDRTIADAVQRAFRDRQVVRDQLELREPQLLREVRLARVGDADLAARDLENSRLFLGHRVRGYT